MNKSQLTEVPPFYTNYVKLVETNHLIEALMENKESTEFFFKTIPKEKEDFRYAEGKWSIKEVLSHIIDTERIMAYRALRFARNDQTPLPGFEENDYVKYAGATGRFMEDIIGEFLANRASRISLFKSLSEEAVLRTGTANNSKISVLALGFIIVGHTLHHKNIIRERYLK